MEEEGAGIWMEEGGAGTELGVVRGAGCADVGIRCVGMSILGSLLCSRI